MMTTHARSAALIAALLTAAASAAEAQDIAFNVAASTDYVFRGISQTNEDAALSAGVDLTSGSFYAGAWASNVDFGDDTDLEVDLYGGFRTEAGGYALDFGLVGYLYGNAPGGADYDYVEVKAAASRAIGPVTGGVALYVSPDFFGVDEEAVYLELNGSVAPAQGWTVSGAVGQQWLDVTADYVAWNLGVGYAVTDNLALDVRYHDTDIDALPIADARVVATVKALF